MVTSEQSIIKIYFVLKPLSINKSKLVNLISAKVSQKRIEGNILTPRRLNISGVPVQFSLLIDESAALLIAFVAVGICDGYFEVIDVFKNYFLVLFFLVVSVVILHDEGKLVALERMKYAGGQLTIFIPDNNLFFNTLNEEFHQSSLHYHIKTLKLAPFNFRWTFLCGSNFRLVQVFYRHIFPLKFYLSQLLFITVLTFYGIICQLQQSHPFYHLRQFSLNFKCELKFSLRIVKTNYKFYKVLQFQLVFSFEPMQDIGISGLAIKKIVKQHPISMGLTVAGLSAAAIYFFSLKSQQKKPPKKIKTNSNIDDKRFQKQEEQILKELNCLKTTRQKFLSASKQFQVEYLEEQQLTSILTQQCVLNIFDKCIQLVDEGELNRIYETSRKARRTVFHKILINTQLREVNRRDSLQSVRSLQKGSNAYPLTSPRNMNYVKSRLQNNQPLSYPEAISFSQMYYRFVCTFEQEFKYLIQKTQKDFTTFLDIEYSLITQSIDYHISKDQNENFKEKIEQWTSSIRQMLKNKLSKYVQTIDSDRIREILNFQIQFMRQKRIKLQETIHKLGISNDQELQALPTFLATILQDAVYQKYEIQQQQMSVEIMHLSKNKQLQFLVEQFKELAEQIVQQMYEQVNKDEILNDSDYY